MGTLNRRARETFRHYGDSVPTELPPPPPPKLQLIPFFCLEFSRTSKPSDHSGHILRRLCKMVHSYLSPLPAQLPQTYFTRAGQPRSLLPSGPLPDGADLSEYQLLPSLHHPRRSMPRYAKLLLCMPC